MGVPNSPIADDAPPAERSDLTHTGAHAERGKLVVLPIRESEPQGQPMGLRVKEDGESERRSVIERIGIAVL